jgi:hypothetical protein
VSTTWYAAFGLLAVLAALNSVFLIAAIRQIGVLHQRVRPIGHGQVGGPTVGSRLPAVTLAPVGGSGGLAFSAPLAVLAYVSPGCDICDDLLPVLRAYQRSTPRDEVELALLTEAEPIAAETYFQTRDPGLPFVRHDNIARLFDIPGSPFVLALEPEASGAFTVVASGVVNTMEQLEDLVQTAQSNVDALASQAATAVRATAPADGAIAVTTSH